MDTPEYTNKQMNMLKVNSIRTASFRGKLRFVKALNYGDDYINYVIEKRPDSKMFGNGLKFALIKLHSIESAKNLQDQINSYRAIKILKLFNTSANQTSLTKLSGDKEKITMTCKEVIEVINTDIDRYGELLDMFILNEQISSYGRLINHLIKSKVAAKKIDVYIADHSEMKQKIKELALKKTPE